MSSGLGVEGNSYFGERVQSSKPGFLFVLPWSIDFPSGVNEVVRNLYWQVQEKGGFDPSIVINDWNRTDITTNNESTIIRFRFRRPWDTGRRFRTLVSFLLHFPSDCWRLSSMVRTHHAKVINAHFPDLSALQFVLLKLLGGFRGSIILSFHGLDIQSAIQARGLERIFWKILLRKVDAIVTCSHDLRKEISKFAPEVARHAWTVWNGIDPDRFVMTASHESCVPKDLRGQPFLLSVGRFERKKGQDVLIEAFLRVLPHHKNLRLVLIGQNGPTSELIRGIVVSRGLQETVILFENLPHACIPWWMKEAKIVVLASRSEPFGIVILEAGMSHKPVIATAVGGVPEILTDGITARLVPPENPEALATAINDLLDNSVESEQLAVNLHKRVIAEFTWERAYYEYVRILDMLCRDAQATVDS